MQNSDFKKCDKRLPDVMGCDSRHQSSRKMGRELFLLLFFFGVSNAYNANNVDLQSVIRLNNPGNSENRFGHSVALGTSNGRQYVYLGAPQDETHGNVYGCEFDGSNKNAQTSTCIKMNGKDSNK